MGSCSPWESAANLPGRPALRHRADGRGRLPGHPRTTSIGSPPSRRCSTRAAIVGAGSPRTAGLRGPHPAGQQARSGLEARRVLGALNGARAGHWDGPEHRFAVGDRVRAPQRQHTTHAGHTRCPPLRAGRAGQQSCGAGPWSRCPRACRRRVLEPVAVLRGGVRLPRALGPGGRALQRHRRSRRALPGGRPMSAEHAGPEHADHDPRPTTSTPTTSTADDDLATAPARPRGPRRAAGRRRWRPS